MAIKYYRTKTSAKIRTTTKSLPKGAIRLVKKDGVIYRPRLSARTGKITGYAAVGYTATKAGMEAYREVRKEQQKEAAKIARRFAAQQKLEEQKMLKFERENLMKIKSEIDTLLRKKIISLRTRRYTPRFAAKKKMQILQERLIKVRRLPVTKGTQKFVTALNKITLSNGRQYVRRVSNLARIRDHRRVTGR